MKNKIYIYNTLSKKKEEFNSLTKDYVGMYVCGPTVYGDPHLGHARPAITFDIVFRYLQNSNYKVRYVRNITDAGHLENDSDEGEDKISKKARLEQLEPMEVVQHYTISYHKAMEHLNCLPPSIEPRATGHIIEQIEMIKKIITNGYAYEVNGSVYLDVKKYNKDYNYGVLSGRNLEDTLEGTRKLDGQNEKRSHVDFAIWKNASKEHIMKWPSPWGTGFPGWHMECSAMSEKYLGKTFDIHGGGNDLTFPHHEAEITQSNSAHGCAPVKYWMHNNMITIDGKKMGKSLGNFITLSDFFNGNHYKLEQAYSPMTIRFFILQAHYRGTLDFSNNALKASSKGLNKLMDSCETILKISSSKNTDFNIQELEDKCYASMNDDFNTPILISHLFEGVKIINSLNDGKAKIDVDNLKKLKELFQFFIFDILGLKSRKDNRGENTTNEIMDLILKLRKKAKISKDFETADLIRDDLNNVGIEIKDGRDGSSWHAKSK
jgi:cysteinyl-tRNA synthetase